MLVIIIKLKLAFAVVTYAVSVSDNGDPAFRFRRDRVHNKRVLCSEVCVVMFVMSVLIQAMCNYRLRVRHSKRMRLTSQ